MLIKDVYGHYSSSRSQVLTVIYPIIHLQFLKFFQVWYAWFSGFTMTITVTLPVAIMYNTFYTLFCASLQGFHFFNVNEYHISIFDESQVVFVTKINKQRNVIIMNNGLDEWIK